MWLDLSIQQMKLHYPRYSLQQQHTLFSYRLEIRLLDSNPCPAPCQMPSRHEYFWWSFYVGENCRCWLRGVHREGMEFIWPLILLFGQENQLKVCSLHYNYSFFKKKHWNRTFFYCASSLKTGHYSFYSDFFGPQTLFLYKYVLALDVCFDLYGRIHFCLHDACYRVYEVPARILSVNSTSDLYIKIIIWWKKFEKMNDDFTHSSFL